MAEELQTSTTEATAGWDFDAEIDAIDAANEAAATEGKTEASAEDAGKVSGGAGIRVKYNGEERELAGDELITAAQKGLNYDKVVEERDAYRKEGAKEAIEFLKEMADSYGLTVQEFMKTGRENTAKQLHDAELANVQKDFPGIDEDAAEEIVSARLAGKKTALKEKAEAAEAAPWEALAEAYPDIKTAGDVPESVRAAVQNGKDPLLAMREHELAQLKAEIEKMKADSEAEKQNILNAQRSTGEIGKASEQTEDDIASLLWSGY